MTDCGQHIGFLSWRASRLQHLGVFLDQQPRYAIPAKARNLVALAGWGRKPRPRLIPWLPSWSHLPFLSLEDGFLRSVDRNDPPLSLIIDAVGIYYDASSSSSMEIRIPRTLTPEENRRAENIAAAWRSGRVSKYNYGREYQGDLPPRYVLVADQTYGDLSVQYGGADEKSFDAMLSAALGENHGCEVIVKTHPDVFTRKRKGYFGRDIVSRDRRVRLLAEDCHPVRLIENAERVYTVTSQIGFEALIWGRSVRCFGMPFYAGWGLTEDELPKPERRGEATLEQLVHAALVDYARYVDPETGQRCEVERIIDYVSFQRRMRERLPQSIHAVGITRWKRPILRKFAAGSTVSFHRTGRGVSPNATVAVWGNRTPSGLNENAPRLRIEDGFLRSVGLGADFTQPLSWVIDDLGIYYDSTRESRLERILAGTAFDPDLVARAKALRESIVSARLTKYNSQSSEWKRPAGRSEVVLVPGQVESDASIRFGAPEVNTNIGLLKAVRELRPDAYIVYKPHPDVVASLRRGGRDEQMASMFCDEIVLDADLSQTLEQVDEVHTMTSLAGFEALLRNVSVTCHGQPFYSGWGLTTDLVPPLRRTRRLSLDELVAGALILYPTYVSRKTGRYTTPEQVVRELVEWRGQGMLRLPLWRRAYRLAMGLAKGAYVPPTFSKASTALPGGERGTDVARSS